ncbi:hypothetical protein CE91St41_28620 [Oscillospiraceae bacterium]|nr:hypothetical protein CE91St40_28620 [Oscillospiraceae bacterium]BDF75973.1 hypothetical protein CE91St41_28620 [Oscillospiraceae bacterium]
MSNLKKYASRAGALALTAALFLGIAGCGGGASKPSESPKSSAPPAQAETQKPAEAQKPAGTGAPLSVSGTINVASKPSPSATYTVAAAVAKMINTYGSGLESYVVTYPSESVFPDEYYNENIQMGIANLNTGMQSAYGTGAWEGCGAGHTRLLSVGIEGHFSVIIATPESGIKTPYDLKGKKVMGLIRGSVLTREVWDAIEYGYELSEDEFQLMEYSNVTEMTTALKEKRVDAIMYPFFGNASWVEELVGMGDGVFVQHDAAVVDKILEKYTGYNKLTIPAGTFRNQEEEVMDFGSFWTLDVSSDVSDDAVYAATKALYDNFEEWCTYADSITSFALPGAIDPGKLGYPVHPGAVRYYEEQGIWTEEHQKIQEENLARWEALPDYTPTTAK